MWHSDLRCELSNPEALGLSSAGGEKLAFGQTFSG